MFSLILRQILQHKLAVFLLLVAWSVGGYFLYRYHNQLFAHLNYFFSSSPLPHRQEPEKALSYLRSAQRRLKKAKTDLTIMAKTCTQIPIKYKGDLSQFAPHWLEKLQNWKIAVPLEVDQAQGQTENTAELPDYWVKHYLSVHQSLKDTRDAMQFAYEIPVPAVGSKSGRTLLVPRFFERYARAVCQPYAALLAWGDYVAYQEKRAVRRLRQAGNPPTQKRIVKELSKQPFYIEALRNHLGGSLSQKRQPSVCQGKLQLACISPQEGIQVYQKLIAVESAAKRPRIYFQLAQAHLIAAQKSSLKKQYHQSEALKNLRLASRSYSLEFPARMAMASLWLEQDKYGRALKELRYLSFTGRQQGHASILPGEFAALAKRALIGVGRLRDADCFAPLNKALYSRQRCLDLKL